jgi:hypothetical protein
MSPKPETMFSKLERRPTWYRAWVLAVATAAGYLLIRVLTGELQRMDYALMVFVNGSVVLDYLLDHRPRRSHP